MPKHTETVHHIRFVGGESFDQKTNTRSWTLYQQIDLEDIHIGINIAILRYHPTHQNDPAQSLSNTSNHNPRSRNVILEGKILGVRSVRDGMIKFITADNSTGGLTTVRAPAKATAISPDGGWIIKAKPLRNQKGPIIRYPTWIGAYDLQTPVA